MEDQENNSTAQITYEEFVHTLKTLNELWSQDRVTKFLKPFGESKVFEFIEKALQDPEVHVRSNALITIDYIYTPQFLDMIIVTMNDENSQIREQAISILWARNPENDKVLEPLINALKDEERRVRFGAVWVLGKCKDVRAVEPLLELLQDEDSYLVRDKAKALAEIGDKRAIQPLLEVLERRPIFLDKKDGTRTGDVADGEIAYALAKFKDPRAYIPISKVLTDTKSLNDEDEATWVRSYAASALGHQGDERAVGLLVAALEDQEGEVREAAADALGLIGSKRAVDPLIRALEDDDDFHVRENAATALGLLKDKRALEPLLRALKSNKYVSLPTNQLVQIKPGLDQVVESNEHTRGTAANALGLLGDKSVTQTLINLLTDESVWIQERAVEGLGRLGDIKALEPLKMIKTNNIDFQKAIAESIEKIEELRQ